MTRTRTGKKKKLEALDEFMRFHLSDVASDSGEALQLVDRCECAACQLFRCVLAVDAAIASVHRPVTHNHVHQEPKDTTKP